MLSGRRKRGSLRVRCMKRMAIWNWKMSVMLRNEYIHKFQTIKLNGGNLFKT
jgi:hypothetical protein